MDGLCMSEALTGRSVETTPGQISGRGPGPGHDPPDGLAVPDAAGEDLMGLLRTTLEAGETMTRTGLALMSHELRTPLSTIMVCADMILSGAIGCSTDPAVARYLHLIHHSGREMMRMMDGFLDLVRIDAGPSSLREEPMSLRLLADEARAMAAGSAARAGVELRVEGLPDLHLLCDRRGLAEVLANLLVIAVEATPPGGRVSMAASFRIPSGTRDADRLAEDGLVIGITGGAIDGDGAAIPAVADPFARTAAALGGAPTVPAAKRLVEAHGGMIVMRDHGGAGTTLAVHLPARRVTLAVPPVL